MQISVQTAQPVDGPLLEELQAFLLENGLVFEGRAAFTCFLRSDEDAIVGTGSLDGNVLKYIAIGKGHQGEGLLGQIMTSLVSHAFANGQTHLFVFSKPQNKSLFAPFGFFAIEETGQVLLMENQKQGIQHYLEGLQRETEQAVRERGLSLQGTVGAIVVNCNPFTNGHRYLLETTAKECSLLHVFVVSSDKSAFPTAVRLALVRQGVADIPTIVVHEASDYLVSVATFPSYFIKDQGSADELNSELDIAIFLRYIVPGLGITCRFVGTEPLCKTTGAYNRQMQKMLQAKGVGFVEVERLCSGEQAISASRVRSLMGLQRFDDLRDLVPPTTYDFILSEEGQRISSHLMK
ncbi:[citrate (pro-3S)-lyase] ligase [Sphaerochaeta sp. PS]|uniref:[citrate (pro-3S)-lyase] ligase n=1 Tax=Sphaerochaeta sp. PS TaxID=3076336 RepID=UPI0028A4046B|nr:[citrate (pro-3S)-lyase] ligase [Sphaerochaeta sp. PS]MDT4761255.1 [citrate (pro-3S)-lyase] ligase [Sphaerochaeta sp. PS]